MNRPEQLIFKRGNRELSVEETKVIIEDISRVAYRDGKRLAYTEWLHMVRVLCALLLCLGWVFVSSVTGPRFYLVLGAGLCSAFCLGICYFGYRVHRDASEELERHGRK